MKRFGVIAERISEASPRPPLATRPLPHDATGAEGPLLGPGFTIQNARERIRFGVVDGESWELCYRDRSEAEAVELAGLLEQTFSHKLRVKSAWEIYLRNGMATTAATKHQLL